MTESRLVMDASHFGTWMRCESRGLYENKGLSRAGEPRSFPATVLVGRWAKALVLDKNDESTLKASVKDFMIGFDSKTTSPRVAMVQAKDCAELIMERIEELGVEIYDVNLKLSEYRKPEWPIGLWVKGVADLVFKDKDGHLHLAIVSTRRRIASTWLKMGVYAAMFNADPPEAWAGKKIDKISIFHAPRGLSPVCGDTCSFREKAAPPIVKEAIKIMDRVMSILGEPSSALPNPTSSCRKCPNKNCSFHPFPGE